ncbi:MAG: transposase [Planctomycetales bacterium]|nr:transposase [bacterium]UNM07590.1 MAG: transposase [Planctomycetales bacterium]
MLVPLRNSNRLKGFDYSSPGYYFVTISTARNRPIFGRTGVGNRIVLSRLGWIAEEIWLRNDLVYPHFRNDEFCLMPDHFHALVQLIKPGNSSIPVPSLSTIVRSFKGCVTKEIRSATSDSSFNVWQHGFHEKIVNNDQALNRIRDYIMNNPQKLNEQIEGRRLAEDLLSGKHRTDM